MNLLKSNFLIIFILICFYSKGQETEGICGTNVTAANFAWLEQIRDIDSGEFSRVANDELIRMAVSIHIVRGDNGTGGLDTNQITNALKELNLFYKKAKIEFFQFGEVEYLDNDLLFEYNTANENLLLEENIPNTINVYFVNSINRGQSSGTSILGYTYLPGTGGKDIVVMSNSATVSGTTLPHEMGHYLGLLHTHGRSNTTRTNELVNGSNCSVAGDLLCDTPADPNLLGKVNGSCQYVGTERDSNGDLFQPNTSNIMSYAPDNCATLFSSGQLNRMRATYDNFRNYITNLEFVPLFKINKSVLCLGEEVVLNNISEGNWDSIEWHLEGANEATGSLDQVTTSYNRPGLYDISLILIGADGTLDEKVLINAIQVVEYQDINRNSLSYQFESSEELLITSQNDSLTFSLQEIGFESNNSIGIDFFTYAGAGQKDLLLLSPLSNPGDNDYVLSFDYAFTYRIDETLEFTDKIRIISKSCSSSKLIWEVDGKSGATSDPSSNSFVPGQNDWQHIELYVPFASEDPFTQIIIESINGNGNNFYIDNINVSYATDIVIRELNVTNELCAGDNNASIDAKASFNGQMIEYSLNGGSFRSDGTFLNLGSGDYILDIKSGNKLISQTIKLSPVSQLPAKPIILFSSNELRLLSSAFEVEWYYNDQLVDSSGTLTIELLGRGSYYVIVRNQKGCQNISDIFTVLGTDSQSNSLGYPNPTLGLLTIDLRGIDYNASSGLEVSLFNSRGKNVFSKRIKDDRNNIVLDISHFEKGIYFLIISSLDDSKSEKILIK